MSAGVVGADAWGGDVGFKVGPKLCDDVAGELSTFIALAPAARPAAAVELANQRAVAAIEGWKRFRAPELIELARACVGHADWKVVHRALFWLERLGDPEIVGRAWKLLDRREPLLRELAALACAEHWNEDAAKAIGADVATRVERRRNGESDPYVKEALRVLAGRIAGTVGNASEPRTLAAEVTAKRADGLSWAPFIPHFTRLESVLPGVVLATADERPAAPEATRELPIATQFRVPLLGFGKEEVARIVLQPFGKTRSQDGKEGALFHTGQDVGACRDGCGLYAIADGVVRWISTGSDMGTGFVVEHHVDVPQAREGLINAVYMHAGGTVYVHAGDHVVAGQLLGRMGLSWSCENGGQFAHLHLGLYPGPFRIGHNYGYGPASLGLDGWLDPAIVLKEWLARPKPAAPVKPPVKSKEGQKEGQK